MKKNYITPYIPFNLKGIYNIKDVSNNFKSEDREKILNTDNVDFFIQYVTPKLRPMSDLIKKINHNGKEIIPLVEMHKINNSSVDIIDISKNSNDVYIVRSRWDDQFYNGGYKFIYNDDRKSFYLIDSNDNNLLYLNDQYQLYNMLFELHFDFFGLIEKGLAKSIYD